MLVIFTDTEMFLCYGWFFLFSWAACLKTATIRAIQSMQCDMKPGDLEALPQIPLYGRVYEQPCLLEIIVLHINCFSNYA